MTVDPITGATFGEVVPPRSLDTSKIEEEVRAYLVAEGYPVAERCGVLCRHPDDGKTFLTLTPDILLPELRLAIEVDPCSPSLRRRTHHGTEREDRLRNKLLGAVGWTVLRLRLGAVAGGHLGDRDVVVESDGLTKAAKSALTDALEDFRQGRPPSVRLVKKTSTPRAAQRRSHVVNIGEYVYADGGHIFSWYPDLNATEKVTLRLCVDGRYLYSHGAHGVRFISEVGLHQFERAEWKDRLTVLLSNMNAPLVGTTKWPWGGSILVSSADHPLASQLVADCEHDRHTLDRLEFWFSTRGHPVPRWSPNSLLSNDGELVAFLHPDAVAIGYRVVEVSLHDGRYGPYQRIAISRAPDL